MPEFLILRLDGPMQAWGTHTFEDYRPASLFPTRSGLLGLIGACLGLERSDAESLRALGDSLSFAVRADQAALRPGDRPPMPKGATKALDFHTVLNARKVDRSANRNPVVSRREYLFDAAFTVAVGFRPEASFGFERVAAALRRPYFTPVLGRRSCPLARPLLDRDTPVEAADGLGALSQIPPGCGLVYAESIADGGRVLQIRDVPSYGRMRQFETRRLSLHHTDVPEGEGSS